MQELRFFVLADKKAITAKITSLPSARHNAIDHLVVDLRDLPVGVSDVASIAAARSVNDGINSLGCDV